MHALICLVSFRWSLWADSRFHWWQTNDIGYPKISVQERGYATSPQEGGSHPHLLECIDLQYRIYLAQAEMDLRGGRAGGERHAHSATNSDSVGDFNQVLEQSSSAASLLSDGWNSYIHLHSWVVPTSLQCSTSAPTLNSVVAVSGGPERLESRSGVAPASTPAALSTCTTTSSRPRPRAQPTASKLHANACAPKA